MFPEAFYASLQQIGEYMSHPSPVIFYEFLRPVVKKTEIAISFHFFANYELLIMAREDATKKKRG